jgi:hypothetical protein
MFQLLLCLPILTTTLIASGFSFLWVAVLGIEHGVTTNHLRISIRDHSLQFASSCEYSIGQIEILNLVRFFSILYFATGHHRRRSPLSNKTNIAALDETRGHYGDPDRL